MSFVFSEHVALLAWIMERHGEIVDRIEDRLLNVQGKEISRNRTRAYFERAFDSCCFDLPGPPHDLARLKGQLATMHLGDGFEPALAGAYPDVFDPLELILRAYDYWEHHRWPGRNGRVTYARTLFGVFVLRQLERLTLRIWNGDADDAGHRLQEIQRLLDRLNASTSSTVCIRDARWLIQTAQGPLTRHLEPYFRIAELISGSFSDAERIEIHRAGAQLAGGHLRSQLRSRARETGRPIDDPEVLAITRNSNSMDAALLVRDLVPLLDAYDAACRASDANVRLGLADAILQGLSADPELLLTRLDLLTPCTMIEDLFIDSHDHARYTPRGDAHLGLLARYGEQIRRLAAPLSADVLEFEPSRHAYSPLGLAYGFCADILSSMALDALSSQRPDGVSLEDMFGSRSRSESQRARAEGWTTRPSGQGARQPVEYSAEWAGQMFERLSHALDARAHSASANASAHGSARLLIASASPATAGPQGAASVSAQEHVVTSDVNRALSIGATAFPKSQIAIDRREGRFLASAESDGHWFGVSKVVLTTCIGQGKDAVITGVPQPVIDVLRLTCPAILAIA